MKKHKALREIHKESLAVASLLFDLYARDTTGLVEQVYLRSAKLAALICGFSCEGDDLGAAEK